MDYKKKENTGNSAGKKRPGNNVKHAPTASEMKNTQFVQTRMVSNPPEIKTATSAHGKPVSVRRRARRTI